LTDVPNIDPRTGATVEIVTTEATTVDVDETCRERSPPPNRSTRWAATVAPRLAATAGCAARGRWRPVASA
jgi:hypothetical protein